MAKHKKTREQKKIADLRRQIYAANPPIATLELKTERTEEKPAFSIPTAKSSSYSTLVNTSYLIKDLRKTAILTAAIVAVQFILLFLLKNHIFTVGGLTY